MAGISKKKYKTKKGDVTKYTITYRDIFGKQHTSGLYDTIKEAKKDLAKFENINPENKSIKYYDIFKTYLDRGKCKFSKNTIDNYNYYYKEYFSRFNEIEYEKVSSIIWQNYFDEIEKNKGAYIAQLCLKIAKSATNYAIKHGLISDNVFNKIEKIQTPKADINHLTVQESKHILLECKKSFPQYFALLFTFIGTGAREGEIFALTKEDFSYKEKTLTINKQFTRNRLCLKPKTVSSNRKIYLFDELNEVINEHIKTLDDDCRLLFPNSANNYQNASNFRTRFFYPLLKLCGIDKRVRLHDLRGTYVDMVLSSGLSIKFGQNQLGHAKQETTGNIYARNNQDMIEKAQVKINSIFEDFEKGENNVSINENPLNKKIIQFPKRLTGLIF